MAPETQTTNNTSRPYESCVNSSCSRSSSPFRAKLWEPKYPPPTPKPRPENVRKVPVNLLKSRSRDPSPFVLRHAGKGTDQSANLDPLFTYSIEAEGSVTSDGKTGFDVTIQHHLGSPPVPEHKTPELEPLLHGLTKPRNDFLAQANSKGQHEFRDIPESSSGQLTLSFNNNNNHNKISSESAAPGPRGDQFPPESTGCKLCACNPFPGSGSPRSRAIGVACDSICKRFPCLGCPGSLGEIESCSDHSACQPCQGCECPCPCLSSSSGSTKEDKATSPIRPRSRSRSPVAEDRNANMKIISSHSPSDSIIPSEGSIEIKSDNSHFKVDWEGEFGQTNIELDLPIQAHDDRAQAPESCTGDSDQIHSYDPKLEAFYTSSCNRSQHSPSPESPRWCTRSGACQCPCATCCSLPQCRSSFPPSPPLSEKLTSASLVSRPPWNPCCHTDDFCPSRKHSTCNTSPCRSPQSRSWSESPPKTPSAKILSRNNSHGSLEIYDKDGELTGKLDWENYPRSDVDTHSTSGTPQRIDCTLAKTESPGSRPTSPRSAVTLSPRVIGSGQVSIQWSNTPSETECEGKCANSSPRNSPRSVVRVQYKPTTPQSGEFDSQSFPDAHPCTCESEEYDHEEVGGSTSPDPPRSVQIPPSCQCPGLGQSADLPSCCKLQCSPCKAAASLNSNCCSSECCCCCCKEVQCVGPTTEGLNKCSSLPPHLQSDWSTSLRCPPNVSRTKPVLYRDAEGHEHIMFADGTIEHLSQHCQPNPPHQEPEPVPRPSCSPPYPPPPRSPLQCPQPSANCVSSLDECKLLDTNSGKFSPRVGDIVIRARQRLPCMYPGKDNGQVAFFTCDYLDLHEGDSIIRLGTFDSCGRWCSSDAVEMYMRGCQARWTFLGAHEGHECLRPLPPDQQWIVRTPTKAVTPKLGDLIIQTVPTTNSFYFWNRNVDLDCHHTLLLLRAYIGTPRVADENHSLECCVAGHLPVGYAELYAKLKSSWLFLGRDHHMFTEHDLLHFS